MMTIEHNLLIMIFQQVNSVLLLQTATFTSKISHLSHFFFLGPASAILDLQLCLRIKIILFYLEHYVMTFMEKYFICKLIIIFGQN